ncbi:MAG: hypothetical protein K2Y33_05800 [Mycolicibacterium frederiksbergense]|nr:hypothetical protein [Mycolicibacterium frederiksbergense]
MTELHALSGDVAGLIGYRRHANGMSYAPPRVGRACIVITCQAPGLVSLPAKFWPDIDELEPEPAPSCGTCGSTDPDTIEGLPYCPNEYHYPAHPAAWRRIAGYAIAVLICAAWLLSLFLYIAGVIQ